MPLSDADKALRRTGLSASDIVVLSGEARFRRARTKHDLYVEKVLPPEQIKPTPITMAMELGHAMERPIIAYACQRLGIAVTYPQPTIQHPEVKWQLCTPDAIVVEGPAVRVPGVYTETAGFGVEDAGLLECKLVGLHMADLWEQEPEDEAYGPPSYVYVQAVWQMRVRRLPFCIVAALLGTELRTYRIEYDDGARELGDALSEIGEKFLVDHVWKQVPPPIEDDYEAAQRMLKALFPKSNGVMLEASRTPLAEYWADQYMNATAAIKTSERVKSEAKAKLMDITKDADGIRGSGWRLFNKWHVGYGVPAYTVTEGRRFDLRRTKGGER